MASDRAEQIDVKPFQKMYINTDGNFEISQNN